MALSNLAGLQPTFPAEHFTLSVELGGGTTADVTYYFWVNGFSRGGMNLLTEMGSRTIPAGEKLVWTIEDKAPGDDVFAWILSANTVNDPTGATILCLSRYKDPTQFNTYDLPLVVELDLDAHFELKSSVEFLPIGDNRLDGMVRFHETEYKQYNDDIFDWELINGWNTYIATSVTPLSDDLYKNGCDVPILSNESIVPLPPYDGGSSPPIRLSLLNGLNEENGVFLPLGTKIDFTPLINNSPELGAKFLNGRISITPIQITRRSDGSVEPLEVDSLTWRYGLPAYTLPAELPRGYAVEIDISLIRATLPVGANFIFYLYEYGRFNQSIGASATGSLVFATGDRLRILPSTMGCYRLSGSGVVDVEGEPIAYPINAVGAEHYSFGLQPDTDDQIVAISGVTNGAIEFRSSPTELLPSEAIRAVVSTKAITANPSNWVSIGALTEGDFFQLAIEHNCDDTGKGTVRLDYPDVIAGSTKGDFNAVTLRVFLRIDGSIIKEITPVPVATEPLQVVIVTNSGEVIESLPPNPGNHYNFWGYGTITPEIIEGSPPVEPVIPPEEEENPLALDDTGALVAGTYEVAIAYAYNGYGISSITHSVAAGCLPELNQPLVDIAVGLNGKHDIYDANNSIQVATNGLQFGPGLKITADIPGDRLVIEPDQKIYDKNNVLQPQKGELQFTGGLSLATSGDRLIIDGETNPQIYDKNNVLQPQKNKIQFLGGLDVSTSGDLLLVEGETNPQIYDRDNALQPQAKEIQFSGGLSLSASGDRLIVQGETNPQLYNQSNVLQPSRQKIQFGENLNITVSGDRLVVTAVVPEPPEPLRIYDLNNTLQPERPGLQFSNGFTLRSIGDRLVVVNGITITVTVQSGKYLFDGVDLDKGLLLLPGMTYIFNTSSSSNNGLSLRFSTTEDGIHADGTEYVSGIIRAGLPGTNGSYIQLVLPLNAPSVLYPYNASTPGMGGNTYFLTQGGAGVITDPVDPVDPVDPIDPSLDMGQWSHTVGPDSIDYGNWTIDATIDDQNMGQWTDVISSDTLLDVGGWTTALGEGSVDSGDWLASSTIDDQNMGQWTDVISSDTLLNVGGWTTALGEGSVDSGDWLASSTIDDQNMGQWTDVISSDTLLNVGGWTTALDEGSVDSGDWLASSTIDDQNMGQWTNVISSDTLLSAGGWTTALDENSIDSGDWLASSTIDDQNMGQWTDVINSDLSILQLNDWGAVSLSTDSVNVGDWTTTSGESDLSFDDWTPTIVEAPPEPTLYSMGSWTETLGDNSVDLGDWTVIETVNDFNLGDWINILAPETIPIEMGNWSEALDGNSIYMSGWNPSATVDDLNLGDWTGFITTTIDLAQISSWSETLDENSINLGDWTISATTGDFHLGYWGDTITTTIDLAQISSWSETLDENSINLGDWESASTLNNTNLGTWSDVLSSNTLLMGTWSTTINNESVDLGDWNVSSTIENITIGEWSDVISPENTIIIGQWGDSINDDSLVLNEWNDESTTDNVNLDNWTN